MRGNEFLDKMGLIDPAYIEAADVKMKKKSFYLVKYASLAACFALMFFVGIRFLPKDEPEQNSTLPMLSIFEHGEGMGFGGLMAYDISELKNTNPWDESSELSTLPVYRNLTYSENYVASVSKDDFKKMRKFILDVADRLGLNTRKLTVTDNAPDKKTQQMIIEKFQITGSTVPEGYFDPTKLIIKAEGLEIIVDQSMTATVYFDPAVSLPEEYNFTDYASYDDNVAVAEYLKTEYRDFIDFDNPQADVHGGDYNIYNQQSYDIEFYNANGNEIEQLINYNFNRVIFYGNSEGKLWLARIFQPDLSDKVGDYPIINSIQAKELLLSGNYITSVPYEISGEEYVRKVELIYQTADYNEYYMPYYRFYVELPEEESQNGLKTYGLYYVPAIESSYISNMPTDIHFN